MKEGFIKSNYHIHTNYCDGHDPASDMIDAAIQKGFESVGVLCHSFYPFSSDWHIPVHEHAAFFAEMKCLKEKFTSIKLYTGVEADFVRGMCTPDFSHFKDFNPDYIIGSVHYIEGKDGLFTVDGPEAEILDGIKNHFGGSSKKAVQEYFYLERLMLEKNDFTILGHPDLVRKHNDSLSLFNENDSWYKKELKLLAKKIASSGICCEINTGAMSRGFTKLPYPSPYFLELLYEAKVPVTVSTDAHSCENIDFWYDNALEYIKKAGYTETVYLKDGKYEFQKI
ncbi:MAG: histidinol-phosphatase [Treponema sp.]|nr:histidinol-phosphatase [Treponema sp.]